MKKLYKNSIIIIIICIVLFLAIDYLFLCKTSNSAEDFLNRRYIKFNGGKEASEFFEKYIDISKYENIAFKYIDNENRKTMYKSYTIFVVDIKYEKKQFLNIMENTLPDTDHFEISKEDFNYLGEFFITKIMLDDEVYKNNYCGVFFADKHNIIRYVFMYKLKRDEVDDIRFIIERSINLNWYENKEDFVFPEDSFVSI